MEPQESKQPNEWIEITSSPTNQSVPIRVDVVRDDDNADGRCQLPLLRWWECCK